MTVFLDGVPFPRSPKAAIGPGEDGTFFGPSAVTAREGFEPAASTTIAPNTFGTSSITLAPPGMPADAVGGDINLPWAGHEPAGTSFGIKPYVGTEYRDQLFRDGWQLGGSTSIPRSSDSLFGLYAPSAGESLTDATAIPDTAISDPAGGGSPVAGGMAGVTVGNVDKGPQGTPATTPIAIVTAANQEATATVNAAKAQAKAVGDAANTTNATNKALQSSSQSFFTNWAMRIFLFIVGSILLAGALYMLASGQSASQGLSAVRHRITGK